MDQVLDHPFIKGSTGYHDKATQDKLDEILENTRKAKDAAERMEQDLRIVKNKTMKLTKLTEQCLTQIQKTESVLLRGIVEATDIICPSCFIILDEKLEEEHFESIRPDAVISSPAQQIASNESVLPVGRRVEVSKVEVDNPIKSSSILSYFSFFERRKKAVLSIDSANLIADGAIEVAGKVQDTLESVQSGTIFQRMFPTQTYFLYLVDEYTMQPIFDPSGVYPISIERNLLLEKKGVLLPLMKLGVKALKLYNGAAGLARCFGYPLPQLSDECTQSIEDAVGALSADSSVSDFDCLQESLDEVVSTSSGKDENCDEIEKMKQQRGKAFRDFGEFLSTKDDKKTFCGLRRILTQKGTCIWTSEKNAKDIENGNSRPEFDEFGSQIEHIKEEVEKLKSVDAYRNFVEFLDKNDTESEFSGLRSLFGASQLRIEPLSDNGEDDQRIPIKKTGVLHVNTLTLGGGGAYTEGNAEIVPNLLSSPEIQCTQEVKDKLEKLEQENENLRQKMQKMQKMQTDNSTSITSRSLQDGPPSRPEVNSTVAISPSCPVPFLAVWKDSPHCESCKKRFSFFRRVHHCRFCGHSFCHKCLIRKIHIGNKGTAPICESCNGKLVSYEQNKTSSTSSL
jgi:hypothetical protein